MCAVGWFERCYSYLMGSGKYLMINSFCRSIDRSVSSTWPDDRRPRMASSVCSVRNWCPAVAYAWCRWCLDVPLQRPTSARVQHDSTLQQPSVVHDAAGEFQTGSVWLSVSVCVCALYVVNDFPRNFALCSGIFENTEEFCKQQN